ncbi:hypothetical protein [Streptomyces sp. NPDC048106]|uniref:hypothetical protein n=1 Tax=Streptomyces sp. NPDC048106 TaxID=3155750 RepID=UPI003452EBE4
MADEQDKWLNRETAERLLRGEPLDAVDPSARDQAERLSRALGALSAEAAPAPFELPGEQAALAAFRKVREAGTDERTAAFAAGGSGRRAGACGRGAGARGHDGGLVRIGAPARPAGTARRPRWGRPVRLALAAMVAAGTLGGVAVAAGSGVLPTPFDLERPGPAATAGADASGRPPAPVAPQLPLDTGAPGGGTDTGRADGSGRVDGPDGRTGPSAHPGISTGPGGRWNDVVTACRDLRSGAGLNAERRRVLENLAGGSARLPQYCKLVLSAGGHVTGDPVRSEGGDNGGQDKDTGQGRGSGQDGKGQGGDGQGGDGQSGDGQGGDDESHPGGGSGYGQGVGEGSGTGGGKVRFPHRGPTAPAPDPHGHGHGRPSSPASPKATTVAPASTTPARTPTPTATAPAPTPTPAAPAPTPAHS